VDGIDHAALDTAIRRAYGRPMRPGPIVIAAAALGLTPGQAFAQATLNVKPKSVHAGERVRVFGTVGGGCVAGDTVTLLSEAFPHTEEFAGVPAVMTPVRPNGTYSKRVRIPRHRHRGIYTVSGRCGGGNFGISRKLRVRRPRVAYCSPTGDLCYGLIARGARPIRLGLTLAARFFIRYRLCIRAPGGTVDCRRFRVHPASAGTFQSRVRWRRRFPDHGPGVYRVRWSHAGTVLGPPVTFKR
jgi:hypothetical protein